MDECLRSDYRAEFYRSDLSQIYVQRVTNVGHSWVPSNAIASPPITMIPATAVQRPLKRKVEHLATSLPSYVESCLVQLCRQQRWMEIIHHCHYHPEEACLVPVPCVVPFKANAIHKHCPKQASVQVEDDCYPTPIFHETALGIVCASKYIGTEEAKMALIALIYANPVQAGASQYTPGHTPLRDLILNDRCTVEIFRILVEATSRCKGGDLVLNQRDGSGLSPIDNLVISVQLGTSLDSVTMLREFLKVKQSICTATPSLEGHTSPLIRLLTMGNAFDSSKSSSPWNPSSVTLEEQPQNESEHNDPRLQRVLQATRLLLDHDPSLIGWTSRITSCTPLHAALRYYGNFEPLIEELLARDPCGNMIRARNGYGDFPIHVACSVGVSLKVFRLIIEKTIRVASNANANGGKEVTNFERNSLIWSSNKSGYTPVDLEWICHVEEGHRLYTARPFYQSEATGMREHCFKQDQYYRDLLNESVIQVMERRDSVFERCNTKNATERREEEAETVFGDFLDRMSLLIRAATTTAESKFGANDRGSAKLVEACKLASPYSPSLPLPILRLFLWLFSEEVIEKDQQGFLPIHYTLLNCTRTSGDNNFLTRTPLSLNVVDDWESFVFQLLQKSSEQCRIKSREGRLSLHHALDHSDVQVSTSNAPPSDTTPAARDALQSARHTIVEKLIDLYPVSVDQKDPITGLYPFMMASVDQSLSIDTVFCLLRRSPSRCLPAVKNSN